MPEQVPYLKTDGLTICLFGAMVLAAEKAGVDVGKHFRLAAAGDRNQTAEVVVTVNGVEVPFTERVGQSFEMATHYYDEEVKAAAVELLKGTRLGRLSDLLQKFEWEIEQEIDKAVRDA